LIVVRRNGISFVKRDGDAGREGIALREGKKQRHIGLFTRESIGT